MSKEFAKGRSSFGVILAAALALAVSAHPARAAVSTDTVVELHPNMDLDSLDPAWSNDTLSREIISNIYEPLIRFKGESMREYVPALAEAVPSVENGLISKDGKTYRFPIRRGVPFHDGSALTCEDARYSLLRFMLLDRRLPHF